METNQWLAIGCLSVILRQEAVVDEGCEYFIACFEGTGEGAGDFGGADAFSIADGDFAYWEFLFDSFELHLDCPSEGFVSHIQGEELGIADCSERS